MFLSVIIPAHNEEKTICKTVDSLMCQDYSRFEIIVVDDGSDDDTGKKLIDHFGLCLIETIDNQCVLKHKTIIQIWNKICNGIYLYLVQKENGGKGDALNAGIGFCHGDYCLLEFFRQKGFHLNGVLQGYQELEYGIAFCIVRPIFDKFGTSMLISGALGLFNKEVVMQLGRYALDTVGEDMELVMRIRQFAAESDDKLKIGYTKEAVCFTELPWIVVDLRKQRIRWTVGLTDVLWKYREMATHRKYSFLEKLTFWYYVLFEKFSPHIEFAGLIMCVVFDYSLTAFVLILSTISFRFLLSIAGSFQSIKKSIKSSENKLKSNLKFFLLMLTFVSIYHWWHSFYRLIAVPSFRRKKRKTNNQGPSWVSPTRM